MLPEMEIVMKHIKVLCLILMLIFITFGCKKKESEPSQQTTKTPVTSKETKPAGQNQAAPAETQNKTTETKPVTASITGTGNPELNKALQDAVTAADIDKIRSIIDSGADVNAKANNGASLLHLALIGGHEAVAALLISKGADTHVKMSDGTTTLHFAVLRNCKEIAKFLLDDGVDANAMSTNLGTPLHIAVSTGNVEIAEILLAKGADINIKNRRGMTPLTLAKNKNDNTMIELLEKHGAE
jgi:ankyrin repeat protein